MSVRRPRHPLDQAVRVRHIHRAWSLSQALLGAGPLFALINLVQPILTDGQGRDALPGLLPSWLAGHYETALAAALFCLAVSEFLRRRYHARHRDELEI